MAAPRQKRKGRLEAPHLIVEYADGTELEVTTTMFDLLGYERYAKQQKWPNLVQDSASTHFLLYTGFHHLKTAGDLNGVAFDAWAGTVASVVNLNTDDEDESGDPTEPTPSQPAPTTG